MASVLRTSLAIALLALAQGCGTRATSVAEVKPLESASPRREPLPDDAEIAAANIIALSLANAAPSRSDPWLARLGAIDAQRQREGLPPHPLLASAMDSLQAANGVSAYLPYAERVLESDLPDTALRRRLERYVQSQPLAIAGRRIGEDRTERFGGFFNRFSSPAVRAATGQPLAVIETGRAALLSLLVLTSGPEVSTRQRQALRAYRDFLSRQPESPDAPRIQREIDRYQSRLTELRVRETREAAEKALTAGRADAALLHVGRGQRIDENDPRLAELRERADRMLRLREADVSRTLHDNPLQDGTFNAAAGRSLPAEVEARIANELLTAKLGDLPARAAQWGVDVGDTPGLRDEIEFSAAMGRLAGGDEDGFFEVIRSQATRDPQLSNVGRHARPIADSDPYRAFKAAQDYRSNQTLKFLFLGPLANGSTFPNTSPLLRPLVWLVELPTVPIAIVSTPFRLPQVPMTSASFSGAVLNTGEEYLRRFPDGAHAEEIHRELESLYSDRKQWSQALVHHSALRRTDPKQIADYRTKIAERTLQSARQPRRFDIRAALYQTLIEQYPDTPAGRLAAEELRDLKKNFTPQSIRVSRAFLIEHPELTEAGVLGMRAELLDGDDDNGELAKQGLLLVGGTYVRLALDGRDPVDQQLSPEAFQRFIGLLAVAYEQSLSAEERALPDPQRDLFFERARLGLMEADLRAAAASSFAFLSRNERRDPVKRRESILPVEVVVQGGLEDFGVAAAPRIRLPRESEDAILYR